MSPFIVTFWVDTNQTQNKRNYYKREAKSRLDGSVSSPCCQAFLRHVVEPCAHFLAQLFNHCSQCFTQNKDSLTLCDACFAQQLCSHTTFNDSFDCDRQKGCAIKIHMHLCAARNSLVGSSFYVFHFLLVLVNPDHGGCGSLGCWNARKNGGKGNNKKNSCRLSKLFDRWRQKLSLRK